MEAEVYVATQFVAAAVNFALGILLLAVRLQSRINRAFATVMMFQGLSILLLALSHVAVAEADLHWQDVWLAYRVHVLLALAAGLTYFVLVYRYRTRSWGLRIAAAGVLLTGFVIQGAFLLDHCTVECTVNGETVYGPLGLVAYTTPLLTALLALYLVSGAVRKPDGPSESAMLIVASSFALWAVIDTGLTSAQLAQLLMTGGTLADLGWPWGALPLVIKAVGLIPAVSALVWTAMACARAPRVSHRSRNTLIALGLALATPLLAVFVLPPEQPAPVFTTFLYGLWRLAVPVAVVYALVRHRLFDIDIHMKKGIVRGTIVVLFLALFFSASKIAENYFSDNSSLLVGGVSAGLALLALSPMEKLGRKVADMLLPNATPTSDLPHEGRIAIFRDQARLIWSDGVMGRKERLVLDQLRERLGIPLEIAYEIEHTEAEHAGLRLPKAAATKPRPRAPPKQS